MINAKLPTETFRIAYPRAPVTTVPIVDQMPLVLNSSTHAVAKRRASVMKNVGRYSRNK